MNFKLDSGTKIWGYIAEGVFVHDGDLLALIEHDLGCDGVKEISQSGKWA